MVVTKELLLLLFTAFAADAKQSPPTCRPLPYHDDDRPYMIKMFMKYHEGLNLTFDCQAMYDASLAAHAVMLGKRTHVDHYWCQYSRIYLDPFRLTRIWMEPAFISMPMDKEKTTGNTMLLQLSAGVEFSAALLRIENYSTTVDPTQ